MIIQAVGGASAATALQNEKSTVKGSHILLGGIVFQMSKSLYMPIFLRVIDLIAVSILVYTTLALEFLVRVLLRRPIRASKIFKKSNGSASSAAVAEKSDERKTTEDIDETQPDFQGISWKRVKIVVFALGFSTLCVFIR